ncbi:hypothetical protein HBI25_126220 [Parastagonospora nodorum]|nr:hypothetical protein HBH51_094210 [Parastagonospora nodorum]KAH4049015.1 hypothetical protein HBH49_154310 [Parastagonospora nodorum]KAH4103847.1 hypothetical protein HBH46_107820 [Parastagonospora nodorum]KAH4187546.1 hypothetical protein HBH42_159250 [Parastagonospora nodorum]KAH4360697.1 hypothetical protein HBH97_203930 [Parastagonospora nodorum]
MALHILPCHQRNLERRTHARFRARVIFGVNGVRFVDDDVLDAFIVAGWESGSVAFDEQFGAEGCLGDVMYRTRLRCVPGFGFQRGEEDPDAFGELVEMHIVRAVLEAFIPHVFVRAIIWSLCCG